MPRSPRGACSSVLLFLAVSTAARAGEPLRVIPDRALLRGPDAVQQLAVELVGDVTTTATYSSEDEKIASVDASGLIEPRTAGETIILVRVGEATTRIPVTVREFDPGPPVHFANQIVPIFTKLGCNAGGCHGKASGQNGFRLSLLGFEPTLDYETLVREGRGRRLFPAAPESSLLLAKAAGRVPHGGGKRLDPQSHDYRLLVRRIRAGMPVGQADAPTVDRIEIASVSGRLTRGQSRQLVVTARYTDGSTEDVTRHAQYQSNEPDVAGVSEIGRVEARTLSGQAAVMARYQGKVAVVRVTVPVDNKGDLSAFAPLNFIDEIALTQWKELGLAPSGDCSDAEFLRRVSIDITGTLPTAEDFRSFVADRDANKRKLLVDRLLERPEYASYFATKWADIFRVKRDGKQGHQAENYRFHDWIRRGLASNVPYDRFARSILTANGPPTLNPATVWYGHLKTPEAAVDDTAQVFLGMRLQCAKCHHHPFEVWAQDDYYGLAAYFARLGRKSSASANKAGRTEEVVLVKPSGDVKHPKTGKTVEPRPLGGSSVKVAANDDPRVSLASWMTDSKNPYFARALVNRYWSHFFGRGLVEPIDDLRVTNPPSNPELLDALAENFVKSSYDMKALIRTICTSRLYGLSSVPNDSNASDRQNFARHYPKRLQAEVLLDAISQVAGTPTEFPSLPKGTRAIELPDEGVSTSFLDGFGRPKRDTACECERVTDASLGQSLLLLNSGDIQQKIAHAGSRSAVLAKDPRPHPEKIAELFQMALGREPSATESSVALAHVEAHSKDLKNAYEDIIWALVNTKEFQFND